MTYQLQIASAPAPEADLDVFAFMNKLRQEAGEQPPSALLKRFHDALAALFPDTPWSEGHYTGDVGRLTVIRRRKVVVPHVLYLAGELGLTVVDNQSGEVHRPPTYQVVLKGPAEGVVLGDAAARLAALMRKPETEMLALLSSGRRTVIKKGVSRFQANQYASALRERAGCRTSLAPEPGPVAHPQPPVPAPEPAPVPPMAPTVAPISAQLAPVMPPLSRSSAAIADAVADAEPAPHGTDAQLFDVAEGVRLICCAIGLNFLTRTLVQSMPPVPAGFSSLLLMGLSAYGCLRLTSGLGYGAALRATFMLLVLSPIVMGFALPFLNLSMKLIYVSVGASPLAMFVLGVIGSRRLKKAGYKIGLFGASKADVRHLGAMAEGERLQSTTLAWATFILVSLAFMGGEATRKAGPKQLTASDVPCDFVGTWEVEKDGGKHELRVLDDGTYSGTLLSGRAPGMMSEYAGRWRYNQSSLVWTDEAYTPVRVAVNNVTAMGRNEFTALDRSGQKAVFQLKQRGKSQRCKFN